MASKGNGKQKEKLLLDMNEHMRRVHDALDAIKKDVNYIQEGDGKNSYWNGNNACVAIKSVLTQCAVDSALLNSMEECKNAVKK